MVKIHRIWFNTERQILSAMEQIKKEQEEVNLKIGFINKKKERKAQEEITD